MLKSLLFVLSYYSFAEKHPKPKDFVRYFNLCEINLFHSQKFEFIVGRTYFYFYSTTKTITTPLVAKSTNRVATTNLPQQLYKYVFKESDNT